MRNNASNVICIAAVALMLMPPVWAAPDDGSPLQPPIPFVWRDKPFSFEALGPACGMAPATRGVSRLVMIAIEFTNVQHAAAHNTTYLDSLGDGPNSLNTYYFNASYGRLNISSECSGWYCSTRTMQYYGAPSGGGQDSNLDALVTEAVNAANPDVDFSQYDQNSDGYVDHLLIIHAGNDQATSGNANDIWSEMGFDSDQPTVDGKKIGLYTMVSEYSPMGVVAHEFGHLLGMPDLYDTDYTGSGGQTDGAGLWDIMASGPYLNSGDTPSLPSAWSRVLLGWANLVTVSSNSNGIVLAAAAFCQTVIRVNVPNHAREYFLVENREQAGYDGYLPGDGLLIWHIDESKGSIQYNDLEVTPGKKRVTLEEAHGGRQDLDYNDYNMGDSRDPWYINPSGFNPVSDPNSSAASDGQLSFISVQNIGAHGMSMTFDIQLDTRVYNLRMTPPASEVRADPGASTSYTVSLYNTGSAEDFNFTVGGTSSEWSTVNPPSLRLNYLQTGSLTVSVRPPSGTPANTTVTNGVTATPASNSNKATTVLVPIRVNAKFRGLFSPSRDIALLPGEERQVNVTVFNNGNLQDTITMSLDGTGKGWLEYSGPMKFTLQAGNNATIGFTARMPWGTQENARTYVVVGGRSQDGSACTAATINLTVRSSPLVEFETPPDIQVKPSVPYVFTVRIFNNGTSEASLSLSAGVDPGWSAGLSESLLLIGAWSSRDVTVTVTAAPGAAAGLSTSVNLTATFSGRMVNASVPATVAHVFGASVVEGETTAEIPPGAAREYALAVHNSGNGPDELTFDLVEGEGGEGWLSGLNAQPARLSAGENTSVTVTVTPPENAPAGAEWHLNLTVGHSSGEKTKIEIIARVMRMQKVAVTVNPPARAGYPGETVVFNLTVSNNGNSQELVALSLKKQDGLNFELEKDSVALEAGASGTVRLNCRLVAGAVAGLRAFNITAYPGDNVSASATAQLKVTVNPVWGADVSMREQTLACDAGKSVGLRLTLTNKGNAPDTYTISKSAGTIGVSFDRTQIALGPGDAATINVTLSVPADAGGGVNTVKISVRSQGKPGEVALKEVKVDVRARNTVTPAMIAIPMVVVIAVCVAVAAAGILHVRTVKRAAAERKRSQAVHRQQAPPQDAGHQQKPPQQPPVPPVPGPAQPSQPPANGPAHAQPQTVQQQPLPTPAHPPGHVEEVTDVTVVDEQPPAGQ